MKFQEFIEQDKYCREHDTPEGRGCDVCPAPDKKHCAYALRKLCSEYLVHIRAQNAEGINNASAKLDSEYGITPFHQVVLVMGKIEFPD